MSPAYVWVTLILMAVSAAVAYAAGMGAEQRRRRSYKRVVLEPTLGTVTRRRS